MKESRKQKKVYTELECLYHYAKFLDFDIRECKNNNKWDKTKKFEIYKDGKNIMFPKKYEETRCFILGYMQGIRSTRN